MRSFASIRVDSWALVVVMTSLTSFAEGAEDALDRRVHGLLVGSVIGDALGGPVEFAGRDKVADVLPGYRDRPDELVDAAGLRRLSETLPLLPYDTLRPDPAPYGPWSTKGAAGTATDDTRNKMVLLAALRKSLTEDAGPIGRRELAEEYIAFADRPEVEANGWGSLCEEGWREFVLASRWVLGERDLAKATPPARMWHGIGTCCGQMTLPPLAALYPGEPERAYLAAYELAFFDNGEGEDINATIVAGLAFALAQPEPAADPESRHAAWVATLDAMKATDPLRYAEIKFMRRELSWAIDTARGLAAKAEGSPGKLYRLIDQACPRQHAWEAKFLVVEAVALGEFCRGEPLAAMHLSLDFGQDTDSAAQLLGAIYGAIYGPDLFPAEMRRAVEDRLEADYDESLDEWVEVLARARARDAERPLVRTLGSDGS